MRGDDGGALGMTGLRAASLIDLPSGLRDGAGNKVKVAGVGAAGGEMMGCTFSCCTSMEVMMSVYRGQQTSKWSTDRQLIRVYTNMNQ